MALSVGALLGTLRLDNDQYMRGLRQAEAATRSEAAKSASDVEKSSARMEAARNKELDAAGKVRIAESQLSDIRQKGNATTARTVQAEERLAAAKRTHSAAAGAATRATNEHDRAMRRYAATADESTKRTNTLLGSVQELARNKDLRINVDADTASAVSKINQVGAMRPNVTSNVDANTAAAVGKINAVGAMHPDVTSHVDANTAPAVTKINAVGGMRPTVTANVDADTLPAVSKINTVAAMRPNVVTNVDADTMAAVSKIGAVAAMRPNVTANVDADTAPALGKISWVAAQRPNVTANVDADTGMAQAKLSWIASLRPQVITNVDADTLAARLKIAAIAALRPNVTVNVNADTGAAVVQLGALTAATGAASMASGILSGHFMAMAGLVAFILAPAIALLGSLVLSLVGAFFVAGAAAGAVALGIDGIKNAAAVAAPALDALKAAVSATFYQGMVPVFQLIGGILLPGITAGMQHVAASMSGAAFAVMAFVTSAQGMHLVNAIIWNTGEFFARITPFLVSMTNGMLVLGAVGSAAMGHLAGVLGWVGAEFNGMIQRLAGSGVLNQAFIQLGNVVGAAAVAFWRLLEVSAHLMVALGPAATGVFNMLGFAIMAMLPFLTQMGFLFFNIAGIVLAGVTPAFGYLAPILGAINWALSAMAPWLSTVLSILIPAVAVIGAVKLAWAALNLVMAMNPFVLIALAIAVFVGTLIWAYNNVGWFRTAVDTATWAIGAAWSWVTGVITTAVQWIIQNWDWLKFALLGLLGPVGWVIAGIWWLAENWGMVWGAITMVFSGFMAWLGAVWGGFWGWITWLFTTIVGGLGFAWSATWGWISGVWNGFAGWFLAVFGGFCGWVSSIWGVFTGFLGWLWGVVWGAMSGAWNAFVAWFLGGLAGFTGWVSGVWGAFTGFLGWLWGVVWGAMSGAWSAFVAWFLGGLSGFVGWVSGVWGAFTGWLGFAWSAVWGFISAVWNGFAAWITGAWSAFTGWISGLWASFTGFLSFAWGQAVAFWTNTWASWAAWISGAWSAFVGWISGLWSSFTGFLSFAWSQAIKFWSDTWASWAGWLSGAWSALVGWISGLWSSFTGFLSYAWQQAIAFWSNTFSTFAGWLSAAWTTMCNFIGGVWNGFTTGIGIAWRAVMDGIEWVRAHILQPCFDAIHYALDAVGKAFQFTVGWIGDMWNMLRGILAKPVNFMIDHVYNGGIKGAWDKVAGWLHLPALPPMGRIPENARGGVIPGYTPGKDTTLSWVGGGEAIMRPEWTRAVGPDYVNHMNRVARSGGVGAVREAMTGTPNPQGNPGEYAQPSEKWMQVTGAGVKNMMDIMSETSSRAQMTKFGQEGQLPRNVTMERMDSSSKFARESISDYYMGRVHLPAGVDMFPYVRAFEGGGIPPKVIDAQNWARGETGKPYIWGGVGPAGYDCSGWTSAITNFLTNRPLHVRRHTTHTFGPGGGDGFVPGLSSSWAVGVTNAGVGHMAGTLGGMNTESSGGKGPHSGAGARGATDPLFQGHFSLPEVGGMFIDGGGGGFDPWWMVKQWWAEHKEGGELRPAIKAAEDAPKKFSEPSSAWVNPFAMDGGTGGAIPNSYKDNAGTPLQEHAPNIISFIWEWIRKWFANLLGGTFDAATATLALIMTGSPLTWLPSLLRRIQQESGGNPRAVNMWDSNARLGGTHGLMQLLHSNFAQYRLPWLSGDIYDPLANIVAGINYTKARYGSGPAGWDRAGGYDSGGWLEPGTTYAANSTGQPEAVLTNEQWRAVEGGGISRNYHLTVYNAANKEVDIREQFRRMEILGGV